MKKKSVALLFLLVTTGSMQATSIDVTVTKKGTLAEKLEQQVSRLETVTSLTVHGPLGDEDMTVWQQLTNLEVLNLSDAKTESFSNCMGLPRLQRVTLPESTKSIDFYAFYFCTSLAEVSLPGIETIGMGAFGACSSLTAVSLPATFMHTDGMPFTGCEALKDVYCYSSDYSGQLFDEDTRDVTLHVHTSLVDYFRQKENFEGVSVVGMDFNFTKLVLGHPTTLHDISHYQGADVSFKATQQLDTDTYLTTHTMGSLTLDTPDSPKWEIGRFTLPVDFYDYYSNYPDGDYNQEEKVYSVATLLNRRTPIEAQQIEINLADSRDMTWMFFAVPFDVQVSDIQGGKGQWVIRRYDPSSRAAVRSGWTTVGEDETLHAGEGYIFMRNYDGIDESQEHDVAPDNVEEGDDSLEGHILLPAAATAAKNQLFATGDVVIPLKKSAADLSHNADWNMVGNPFPCYFDISAIKEHVTIYVFDEAENLYRIFDTKATQDFFLAPCQTFFVQGTDVSQLTFQASGRRAHASFGLPEPDEQEEENAFSQLPTMFSRQLKAKPSSTGTTGSAGFNPESPLDPGANYFNPTTGEAYFDLFPEGHFIDAVKNLFNNDLSAAQEVKLVTVAAPMSESDMFFVMFPYAERIDLKQSTGFLTVPDGAFSYMSNLHTVILPSCVTAIQDKAFGDAAMYMKSTLEQLDLYATTPPVITQEVFAAVKDKSTLVIRVPAEAVPLYKAANVWRDLNIQPLDGGAVELQSVTLAVKAPDGQDLSEECNILWYDEDHHLLGAGAMLTAQPVGSTVTYSIGLPPTVAALYKPVPEGSHTVQPAGNVITIALTPTGVVDMGMKQLQGSSATLDVTFMASDSEAPSVFNSADVVISILDKETAEPITDVVLQYPNVSFEQTELQPGQTLRVGISSRSSLFKEAENEVTVDQEGSFNARLLVKEWGHASISCKRAAGVDDILALVFDQNDRFVTRFKAHGNVVKVKDLPDGAYQVVLIQQNQYLNAVASLTDLHQTVLRQDTDYTLLSIQLTAGTTRQYEGTVPALDEQRMSHISTESYLTTNDPETTIGTNATYKAKAVFKEEFAAQVSNLQLIVDIPEGMVFVANSVIASAGSYQLMDHRLIIPCQQDEQVRWCLRATQSGQKDVTAMVRYTLGHQQYLQPIGSATTTALGLSLDIATTTTTPQMSIHGYAFGGSHVTIYDGRAIVAETTAKSDGSFSADITLNPALDGTYHKLYADIETSEQPFVSTETSTVLYDKHASVLNKVSMIYQEQTITWNEQTGSAAPSYFNVNPSLSPTTTFTASLINPRPDCILDPYFEVMASDGSRRTLDATWNEAQQLYTAVADYPDSYRLPVEVQFLYTYADSTAHSRQELFDTEVNALVAAHNQLVEGIEKSVSVGQLLVDEDDHMVATFRIGDGDDYTLSAQMEDFNSIVSMHEELERPIIRSIIEGDTVASFFIVNNENSTTVYYANLTKHEAHSETFESPAKATSRRRKVGFGDIVSGAVNGIKNYFTPTPSNLLNINKDIDKANGKVEQANKALEALNYIDEMQARYDEFNNILSNRLNLCQYLLLARCPNGDLRVPANLYGHFQGEIRRQDDQRKVFCKQMQSLILSYAQALENAAYKEIAKELAKFVANYCLKTGLSKGVTRLSTNMAATGVGTAEQFSGFIHDGFNTAVDMGVNWAANQITQFAHIPTDYAGVRAFFEKWTPQQFHSLSMASTDLKFSIQASYSECKEEEINRPPVPWAKNVKKRRVRPVIDPSGFVYEATPENRVEGVTATIYYKENDSASEQLWDAAEYGQQNPLLTDAAGLYMWNVPEGLWQVRFEKEGYEPVETDWLPVPPPQLEVNVPMRRNSAPAVSLTQAFTNKVTIDFDRYMQSASLQGISVSQDGQQIEGMIEPTEECDGLTRSVTFRPLANFTAKTIHLTVPTTAKSYAGISLEQAYTAALTVDHVIEGLLVQDDAVILSGQTGYVSVTAYPAIAVSGKTLNVSSRSPLIALEAQEVRFDDNGQCLVPISGLMPGMAQVTFAVGDLQALADVEVKYHLHEVCATPVPTVFPGAVAAGTEVELYCSTEDATIYYTTDGSCPCDEAYRQVYTTPIVINQPMTIQAIAMCEGMDDSDVTAITYTIADFSAVLQPQTATTGTDSYYNLRGMQVQPPLPQGLYIHVQRTPAGMRSQKVWVRP